MKKIVILLLFLSMVRSLSAQKSIYEEVIGWKGNRVELHTISDQGKQQNAILLLNSDSVRVLLLDSALMVTRRFGVRRDLVERLLGGFMKGGKIYLFFHIEHGEPHMHGWTFDTATGSQEEYYIPFELKNERLLDRVSYRDHFLCLAVARKTSDLVLYDFRDGKNYDSLHYAFPDGVAKKLTHVAKLDQEGESNLKNSQASNKVYLIRDTFYLLMNVDKGITGIFYYDLQHRRTGYRVIRNNAESTLVPSLPDYTDNCYLLDGKLYFVSVNSDSLHVEVRDFGSGALLREYVCGKEDTISFKNTPIIQDGRDFSKSGSLELTTTQQLIGKMLNGSVVIMANREDSDRVSLWVGSYPTATRGGGGGADGGGVWMPGVPVSFFPIGGFYRSVSWTKSARFSLLLDAKTSEHLPGDMPVNINRKIETYTEGTPILREEEILFQNNGKTIYGYYSREERKLTLVQF